MLLTSLFFVAFVIFRIRKTCSTARVYDLLTNSFPPSIFIIFRDNWYNYVFMFAPFSGVIRKPTNISDPISVQINIRCNLISGHSFVKTPVTSQMLSTWREKIKVKNRKKQFYFSISWWFSREICKKRNAYQERTRKKWFCFPGGGI